MHPEESNLEPEDPAWSEDLEKRPDRGMWIWISLIVVIGLAVGLGGGPVYRFGKAWRARRLVAEAQEDFRSMKFTNGAPKLRTAIGLAPDDTLVLRLAAETLTAMRSPEALGYWSRLEQKGALTDEDRLNRARFAVGEVRIDQAKTDLEYLYRKSPTNPAVLGLSIDLFQRMGNTRKAREAAAELLKADPESPSGRFAAGSLLASDPSSETNRKKGRELLMQLALAPGPQQTNAWRTLGAVPDLGAADCLKLVGFFTNRSPIQLDDLTAAAEFSRKADTNSMPVWVRRLADGARGKHQSPGFLNAMMVLMDWNFPAEVVDVVTPAAAKSSPDLYALRIQALANSKQWVQVEQAIDDPSAPISKFQQALFRGALAVQTGRKKEVDLHWRDAEQLATNQMQIGQLAESAGQMGLWEISASAWRKLVPTSRDRFATALAYLKAAQKTGNDRLNLDAHRHFLEVVPDDVGVRTESVYLQLVLGENVDSVVTQLAAFPASLRSTPRIQFLSAFADLRKGNMNDGLANLERHNIDWTKMEARWRALYAALLSASGQREAARRSQNTIKPSDLTTAERECFGTWLPSLR